MKEKILVAMSGGVDSAVAACLLKEQGYDVIGVTLSVWEEDGGHVAGVLRDNVCCSYDDAMDARSVAHRAGFPHYVLNFKKLFKETVIDNFVSEYASGRTPNPCVQCNKYIKFEPLLQKALELGADTVATGHYARLEYDEGYGCIVIRKSADKNKDQSYVLYPLKRGILPHIMFPLGGYEKDEVRELARKYELCVADKKESQDICFVAGNNYRDFVKSALNGTMAEGSVVTMDGNVVGKHQGIATVTVGQRKGLGVSLGEPYYVAKVDAETNTVVLGKDKDLMHTRVVVEDVNWLAFEKIEGEKVLMAKVRYRSKEQKAKVLPHDGAARATVEFFAPQRAMTPGQSIVFYDGDILAGGGVIQKVLKQATGNRQQGTGIQE